MNNPEISNELLLQDSEVIQAIKNLEECEHTAREAETEKRRQDHLVHCAQMTLRGAIKNAEHRLIEKMKRFQKIREEADEEFQKLYGDFKWSDN